MEKRLSMILAGLFLCIGMALAQTKITGTVISSEDGEPVIGATVMIQGTKQGVATNVDGQFSLSVPAGKKIEVSSVGMVSQTVAAKNGMTITLHPDESQLEEVVVTGVQKMDRRLFTGATDKLNAADAMLGGMPDISRSLEGRSAGVSVQNVSGTFGTAPKIRIRGATSIYGSSKPLWVVDGVIMEDVTDISADDLSSGDAETLISSAIAGLNSDDIESFQILKDGSATSIYGARAMAGVIVVTTKKGKAGQARINYTGEFTSRLKPQYRDFNILNSQDQMGIYQEMQQKGWFGLNALLNGSDYGVYGKMYELMNTYNPTTGQFGLANTPEAQNAYLRQAEYRNTDWFDELFSTDIVQNHSMSISGGTEKSQYYVSMSAMLDPGWYKDNEVKRYTANMNVSHDIMKSLTVNLIGTASYRKQKAPGTLSQDIDVVSGQVKRDFDINPYSYALNTSRALDPSVYYQSNYAPFNILHELETNYIDMRVVDTKFQAELKWKPIQGLEVAVLAAIKNSTTSRENKILDDSNQAMAYRAMGNSLIRNGNKYLYTNPDDIYALPITVLPEGGIYQRIEKSMTSHDYRLTANYGHTFNDTHIVNMLAGAESTRIERNGTNFTGWGMQYAMGEIPFYIYEYFKKGIEENTNYYSLSNTNSRSVAFFANATYSYKGRYVLTGTYRYEGSNQLGKSRNARWLPTWNVAGSWNAHEEPWFHNVFNGVLSHLTLKGSYSLTATPPPADLVSSTNVLMAYTPYRPFATDKETAIHQTGWEDADLTYEKKNELNIGADFGLLHDRINVALDVYTRKNFDEIGPINTQGVSGQIIRWGNQADMKSSGIELSISSTNIKTKDFSWNTQFVYSSNKTEITNLKNQATVMDLIQGNGFGVEGYPVRALFSIPFLGLNEDGMPTFLNEKGEVTVTDLNFQERDNIGFLKYEGPTDPKYIGSLGNTFKYKGFQLDLFFTYSFGNVIRLDPVFSAKYSDLSSMTKEFKNRWMMPGDEKMTDIPVILSYRQYHDNDQLRYGYNAYNYSTARIAKGDFIRLKEIALSYAFPRNWFKSTPINNLSLKLQATNLFLVYADKKLNGQDPEFVNAGGVASPVPKQFTMTLRVGF